MNKITKNLTDDFFNTTFSEGLRMKLIEQWLFYKAREKITFSNNKKDNQHSQNS